MWVVRAPATVGKYESRWLTLTTKCNGLLSGWQTWLVSVFVFCQVAGVVSSVIVLITVLKLGPLFEDLPKVMLSIPFLSSDHYLIAYDNTTVYACVAQAVLSTIVLVNLKGMFKQFMDVPTLWKTNKTDLVRLKSPSRFILLHLTLCEPCCTS